MTDRSNLITTRNRLPNVSLSSVRGNPEHLLRAGRSLVLILIHDDACMACREYLNEINETSSELAEWNADVAVIVPRRKDDRTFQTPAGSSFRWLNDSEHRIEDAAAVTRPAVLIVDQWREIKQNRAAGSNHSLLRASEIVSWVRYLGTQCPECEGETL
jgi:hypothetical protein